MQLLKLECEDVLYGCLTCTKSTVGSFEFPQCTQCQDGLYLLKNNTLSTNYPSQHSYCVPDCTEAHQSFVNTQFTTCEYGGLNCPSTSWKFGCEKCTGANWAKTGPLASHYFTSFKECQYSGSCTDATTGSATCQQCATGFSQNAALACKDCKDDKFYPGGAQCKLDASNNPLGWTTCKDGYNDGLETPNTPGKCITNCGSGKYGATTFSTDGWPQETKCKTCVQSNCLDCIGPGAAECTACDKGYYLVRAIITAGQYAQYGTCSLKNGAGTVGSPYQANLYVQSDSAISGTYFTGIQSVAGTAVDPFFYLSDAIAKAYEIGAVHNKAIITILLKEGTGGSTKYVHYMRRLKTSEVAYQPLYYDNTQTTSIIIQPDSGVSVIPQVIKFKMRDRYTFPVGGGLTIKKVSFEALDSVAYYDNTNEVVDDMAKSVDTCKLDGAGLLDKCNGKTITLPKASTDQCLFTQGMGAGLFTFDISPQTAMTAIPKLTLDTVKFYQWMHNFNSLIEFNSYGGAVEIISSTFDTFNTCGAIIRNKRAVLQKSFTPPATDDYKAYYLERSNRYLYELLSKQYAAPGTNPICPTGVNCYSITISGTTASPTTFANFGTWKTVNTAPIAVSAAGGLQYYGQILDLDNFNGPVTIYGATFTSIGPRYSSCDVATAMLSAPTGTDSYPSYGLKDKYQIKSLISITNHPSSVDITHNTFTDCSGTKGIIYLDFKHKANSRRSVIAWNTFTKNYGYLQSNVLFIRARGPTSTYSTIPTSGNLYCTGFHFEKNTFDQNFGCYKTSGGVLKFECLDPLETSATYSDSISLTSLPSSVIESYYAIDPTTHLSGGSYQFTFTLNAVTYTIDTQLTQFILNTYSKNLGTGGQGLLDIRGVPRLYFTSETFINNGDSQREVSAKIKQTGSLFSQTGTDTLLSMFQNGATVSPTNYMKSLINIERTSYVYIWKTTFTSNWMIDNSACDNTRGQLFTFNDFGGRLYINTLTLTGHTGAATNTYLTTGSGNLNLPLTALTGVQKLASKVPLMKFQNTVKLFLADFSTFSLTGINFYEDSACYATTTNNMLFGFWGAEKSGAIVETFKFQTSTTLTALNCYLCSQAMIRIGESASTLIKTVTFSALNQGANSVTYPSYSTLFTFYLKRPITIAPAPERVETITLDTLLVSQYAASKSGTTYLGRLMEFFKQDSSDPTATYTVPTVDQVVIKSSAFTSILVQGDGGVGHFDAETVRLMVQSTTFTTITGQATSQYGGVFNVASLGRVELNTITATTFNVKTTSTLPGGGKFLYTSQDAELDVKIASSTFSCSATSFTASDSGLAAAGSYQFGSAFHLESQTQQYTVDIQSSTFKNCFGANKGGAIMLSSVSSSVLVNLKSNVFQGNVAVNGGSLYCERCEIVGSKLINNKFTGDYAQNGANMYIIDLQNVLTIASPLVFDGASHQTSAASNNGGGVYLMETVQDVFITIQKVDALATVSEFRSLTTANLDGGAFYFSVPLSLTLIIKDTAFADNIAGTALSAGDGGAINIVGATTNVDITIQTCTITGHKAGGGKGGVFSIPQTSTDSLITVLSSTFGTNEAKTDGGLFYIGGTGDKVLNWQESTVLTTKARTGNGGLAYISGSTSTITVTFAATSTTPQIKDNQALVNDGGLFYSTVTGGVGLLSCSLTMTKANVESSIAYGKGGMYYCAGGGYAGLHLTNCNFKTQKGLKNGGLYYVDVSNGDIDILMDGVTTITYSSTDDTGGLGWLRSSNDVIVQIDGPGSTVGYSSAKKSAGGFFMDGTNLNKLTLGAVAFANSEAKDGEGAIAVMNGQFNYFTMDKKGSLDTCTAAMNGGCFMMKGVQKNELYIIGDATFQPELKSFSVTSTLGYTQNGGFIYLKGIEQIVTLTNIVLTSSSAGGNGGVIYSDVSYIVGGISPKVTITVTSQSIQMLQYITAGGLGSFYYQSQRNLPEVVTTISNSVIKCKSLDFCSDQTRFGQVYDSLVNQATTTFIGGLFYFEEGSWGTVTTDGNTFTQCYTTQEGSVFYLTSQIQLYDTRSQFVGNAGKKGQIYCYKCTATFQESNFFCSIADQAALIFIDSGSTGPAVSVTFITATIRSGRAINDGGGVYVAGSAAGNLRFQTCGLIDLFETPKSGGFFFIENPSILLDKTGSNWNHLWAGDRGGLVEGMTMVDSSFSLPCKLGNITETNPALHGPPFAAGGLSVQGCQIACGTGVISIADQPTEISKAVGKFSLYRFSGKVINSTNNAVHNCLAEKGAIFYLDSTDMTDEGSTYSYNGGVKGGVAYCVNCRMHFKGTIFEGNFAQQGGTFYIEERGTLILENVQIKSSRSTQTGGLIYAQGTQSDLYPTRTIPMTLYAGWIEIKIFQTTNPAYDASSTLITFGNIDSGGNGGGIYLKNGVLDISTILISAASAANKGGFIYSDDLVEITMRDVHFDGFSAGEQGGFIYANGLTLPAQYSSSYLEFFGVIQFTNMRANEGGSFYLNNPQMHAEFNTDITVQNSKTTGGNGGVFYISSFDYLDFRQSITGVLGKYYDMSVAHPSKGSFIYSEAVGVTIYMEDLDVKCQLSTPSFATDLAPFLTLTNTLPLYGGAIYIVDASSVLSKKNTYRNCYQTNSGGVFYISTSASVTNQAQFTYFEETNSLYEMNQAEKGGVLFCDRCRMSLSTDVIGIGPRSVVFQNNSAKVGGAIFIQETSTIDVTNVQFIDNMASQKGGAIACVNTNPLSGQGTVTFTTTTFDGNFASDYNLDGSGGVFYFQTIQLSTFTLQTTKVLNSHANSDGGVFYVNQMSGLINILSSTLTEFKVSDQKQGSLFYSGEDPNVQLSIDQSTITCTTDFFDQTVAIQNLVDKVATKAGAIYMEKSLIGVISTDNVYQTCFNMYDGGIFYIVDSLVDDQRSSFIDIYALYGGVMKCRNCVYKFTDSILDGNQAQSGGVFMFENQAAGVALRTSFRNTKAVSQGGLLSVIQSGLDMINPTELLFQDCPFISGNEATEGGVFYMNQPKITIRLLRSIVADSRASIRGGVIYIQSGIGFIIEDSTVQDIYSDISMILYSTSTSLVLQIIGSTIQCDTSLSQYQVEADFQLPEVPYKSTNGFYLSGDANTQIITKDSFFSSCGISDDGGIFRMEGKVNYTDSGSLFHDNAAVEGGIFSCSQCNITLVGTQVKSNKAQRGGVVKLESNGNLTTIGATFEKNSATEIGGVIFVTTQSVFNLIDTQFLQNQGNVSSTIDVLGASSTLVNYITGCYFNKNNATKNTVSLNKARAEIKKTTFKDNTSTARSKNLFVAFAEVNVTECTFSSPTFKDPEVELATEETMGAFIFIILDVQIIIKDSTFLNGLAKYGGAIYISGQSEITIMNSFISNNMAQVYGGAIFANGFKSIKLLQNSKLTDNIALLQGDDFYLSNTEDALEMEDVSIKNPYAMNSLYAEQITLKLTRVKYQHIQFNPNSQKGAAIYCFGCRTITIVDSVFKNLKSQEGGAIHIVDFPTNKKLTDLKGKYRIIGTKFESITAYLGGALYLDHPQLLEVTNCTFNKLYALNNSDNSSSQFSGMGGAIYYLCSQDDSDCDLQVNGLTNFTYNFAQIQGGSIYYNYYEPKFGRNVSFRGNKAGWYGDSVASYSTQLKPIPLLDYKRQLNKINNPMTLSNFTDYIESTNFRRMRLLQDEGSEVVDVINGDMAKQSETIENQRSGGVIPDFQLAHVDKYGQIVADFDSKIRVSVDSEYYHKDYNTKRYTPILEGTTQYTSYGGVAQVSDLQFSGAPGYKYRLAFLSSGINENLPVNKAFIKTQNTSSIEFDFFLELRECIVGESFSQLGKCTYCDQSMGYLLIQLKEPGDCKECQIDRSVCTGGSNIGPKPGYWRKSNASDNFIRCPNPDVCLGWVAPTWNPQGECAIGQYGLLCAQCQPGYSLTGLAKCGKCPELISNVVKLVGVVFLVGFLFVFMVRSTIAGATQAKNNTSIYMKILMNHFQLVLLVSSFNFQWPEQLEVFFKTTSPVSEASTQVVSVDCFMAEKASFASDEGSYFKTYFIKLTIFAMLPFLLGAVSYTVWGVQKCIKKLPEFQYGKAMATMVISLFTIHPNIVQQMFNNFNCKDIDGDQRVYTDMTIQCWSSAHTFWSYVVSYPSIVIWGLGIPFFALMLMFREREHLDRVSTKEKFGFLYAGYQRQYFYWEIVIMYRKIAMIFISVFIQPYGVISQALIVFFLMIVFLIANLKKKPYLAIALNDLETISLVTSSISIYCGIFFISDIPSKDIGDLPQSVKGGITLSEQMKFLFFSIIMISNMAFFGYWIFKMIQEVQNTILKKMEKLYLYLVLCGDRVKLEKLKNKQKIDEENELLREKYFKAVNNLKNVYKHGKLVLTHQTLERAVVYLNEDKYFEALGLGRRDVTENDLRRYNRMTVGSEIKHNEKEKGMYSKTFRKNMDLKGGVQPLNGLMMIDEEYLESKKPTAGMNTPYSVKVVPIRPDSQQTIMSGDHPKGSIVDQSGYNDDASHYQQTSTNKLTTNHNMFESDDEGKGGLPINERGTLERPLGNKVRKPDHSLKMVNNIKNKNKKTPGGDHQGEDSSIQFSSEDGEHLRKLKKKGPIEHGSDEDADSVDSEHRREKEDEREQQDIWDEVNEQLNTPGAGGKAVTPGKVEENIKEQRKHRKAAREAEKIMDGNIDLSRMIMKGEIQFQAATQKKPDQMLKSMKRLDAQNANKGKKANGGGGVAKQRKAKTPAGKPDPKKMVTNKVSNQVDKQLELRLEKELYNNSRLSEEDDDLPVGKSKQKQKKQRPQEVEEYNDSDLFSDQD